MDQKDKLREIEIREVDKLPPREMRDIDSLDK
jgi:hypothetical protein